MDDSTSIIDLTDVVNGPDVVDGPRWSTVHINVASTVDVISGQMKMTVSSTVSDFGKIVYYLPPL